MKNIIGLFLCILVKSCMSSTEIDIDQLNNTNYMIHVGEKAYTCNPKKPPISHGWSYECDIIVENTGTNRHHLR